VDWIREVGIPFVKDNFVEVVGGVAILMVVYWLWKHSGGKASAHRGKYWCKHCNWEGHVDPKRPQCRKCGSTNMVASMV
jgi:hypothetical protein